METLRRPLLVALAALAGAAAAPAEKTASITLVNRSTYPIHHLYLAPSGDETWGPDQLGRHVLTARGGSFRLSQVPCDTYDVKLVDGDGDECEVSDVDICGGSETWTITDQDLLACEGWGQ